MLSERLEHVSALAVTFQLHGCTRSVISFHCLLWVTAETDLSSCKSPELHFSAAPTPHVERLRVTVSVLHFPQLLSWSSPSKLQRLAGS